MGSFEFKLVSQSDLGKQVGTSGDIIGKYERNEVKPSIEVASKISDVLEVSLDFLLGKITTEVNKQTLKRIQDIDNLPEEDKNHIFYMIDNLIKAAKLKSL
ncbi:MAG: helix-turn-helix transcriptional regulator [Flavobacteriales bacterium]|nr:helix-turn-helix transcriptional regulator [Flavobacteriales bacterium]